MKIPLNKKPRKNNKKENQLELGTKEWELRKTGETGAKWNDVSDLTIEKALI
jgi:hypothetical protein